MSKSSQIRANIPLFSFSNYLLAADLSLSEHYQLIKISYRRKTLRRTEIFVLTFREKWENRFRKAHQFLKNFAYNLF